MEIADDNKKSMPGIFSTKETKKRQVRFNCFKRYVTTKSMPSLKFIFKFYHYNTNFSKNADYICDKEDDKIIESIRKSKDKRIVVRIGEDIFINFFIFKCLLNPTAHLYDDVSSKKLSNSPYA